MELNFPLFKKGIKGDFLGVEIIVVIPRILNNNLLDF